MKPGKIRLGTMAFLLATGTFFVFVANAEDAQAPASDSGAAVADAGVTDADVDGDADASPPLPAIDAVPFPEEKSPRPKKEEWKNAPEVAFPEGSSLGFACKVYRLREWIQIRCSTTTAQITLMCGNPEDVHMELDPLPVDWGMFPEGGELVFAVRKGDRRLFEWQGIEWGYKGANTATSMMVISEMWLADEDKPTLMSR